MDSTLVSSPLVSFDDSIEKRNFEDTSSSSLSSSSSSSSLSPSSSLSSSSLSLGGILNASSSSSFPRSYAVGSSLLYSPFDSSSSCDWSGGSSLSSVVNSVSTGTTITACIYDKGVILGADSRTSSGAYIVNRAARKISRLHDRICVCRSGSAADTQTLTNIVKFSIQQYVSELPVDTLPRVKAVSQLFRRLCYDYKDHLSAGLIVAGYDDVQGPQIYAIPAGGAVLSMRYASGGSGSTFITAYMDDNWREGMTKEEAKKYIQKCVAYAASRDGASGGLIRTVCIEKDSVEEDCIYGKDLPVQPSE